MSITAVQCIRAGDSGKGKINGLLGDPENCDVGGRGFGGHGAGYRQFVKGKELKLSVVPVTSAYEGLSSVIGRGMYVHIPTLVDSNIQQIRNVMGHDPVRDLTIDGRAHIVFDGHAIADAQREGADAKFGSTKNGMSQVASDKYAKVGKRMEWLLKDKSTLKDEYAAHVAALEARFNIKMTGEQKDQELNRFLEMKEMLGGNIKDGKYMRGMWRNYLEKDARILAQAVQGSRLSINSDGYPNVTSSSTTVAGLMDGLGLPANLPVTVVGTMKPYDTFVGKHNVRTQMDPEQESRIQIRGKEFGTRTGRRRSVHPLDLEDAAALAYEEGVTYTALLKQDVLDEEDEFPVCVGTQSNGEPEYVMVKGWKENTNGIRRYEDLPARNREFHNLIERVMGIPIGLIGTGESDTDIIDLRATKGLPI